MAKEDRFRFRPLLEGQRRLVYPQTAAHGFCRQDLSCSEALLLCGLQTVLVAMTCRHAVALGGHALRDAAGDRDRRPSPGARPADKLPKTIPVGFWTWFGLGHSFLKRGLDDPATDDADQLLSGLHCPAAAAVSMCDAGAQVWDERSQAQVIEVQRFRPYAKQSAVQLLEEMMRVRQVRLLSACVRDLFC